LVFDAIAEGIAGFRQLPGEDLRSVHRVCHDGGIVARGARRPVDAPQAVPAGNFPVVVLSLLLAATIDSGGQSFGSRSISRGLRWAAGHGDQILGPRKEEDVLDVVVERRSPGRLAPDPGDTQAPTESKRSVAVPGTVDEVELGLEAVSAGRQNDRDREIAGPG